MSLIADELTKDDNTTVTRSLPMKSEWRKLRDDMMNASDQADQARSKWESKKSLFWSTVENDLQDFGHQMRYNKETDEIEVLADEEEDNVPKGTMKMKNKDAVA